MKKVFAMCLLAFVLVNCGDKNDPEPAKTLNKSLLTDKDWRATGFSHYFRSDGRYGSATGIGLGSWNWMNNSDSLFINNDNNALKDEVWYVEYITATEMKAKYTKKGGWAIFTVK